MGCHGGLRRRRVWHLFSNDMTLGYYTGGITDVRILLY